MSKVTRRLRIVDLKEESSRDAAGCGVVLGKIEESISVEVTVCAASLTCGDGSGGSIGRAYSGQKRGSGGGESALENAAAINRLGSCSYARSWSGQTRDVSRR